MVLGRILGEKNSNWRLLLIRDRRLSAVPPVPGNPLSCGPAPGPGMPSPSRVRHSPGCGHLGLSLIRPPASQVMSASTTNENLEDWFARQESMLLKFKDKWSEEKYEARSEAIFQAYMKAVTSPLLFSPLTNPAHKPCSCRWRCVLLPALHRPKHQRTRCIPAVSQRDLALSARGK